MRPWLPYVIAGGAVAGEGGGLIPAGAEFYYFAKSGLFMPTSLGNIYMMFALPFIIIGIISLPIGLILLGVGLNKKKKMKSGV